MSAAVRAAAAAPVGGAAVRLRVTGRAAGPAAAAGAGALRLWPTAGRGLAARPAAQRRAAAHPTAQRAAQPGGGRGRRAAPARRRQHTWHQRLLPGRPSAAPAVRRGARRRRAGTDGGRAARSAAPRRSTLPPLGPTVFRERLYPRQPAAFRVLEDRPLRAQLLDTRLYTSQKQEPARAVRAIRECFRTQWLSENEPASQRGRPATTAGRLLAEKKTPSTGCQLSNQRVLMHSLGWAYVKL